MTGSIPFSAHPRRVVHSPDGTDALVAIRRDRYRRTGSVVPLGLLGEVVTGVRWLLGNRPWLVELYRGVDDDIGFLPAAEPDQTWPVADHDAAVAGAEALCTRLRRGERPQV